MAQIRYIIISLILLTISSQAYAQDAFTLYKSLCENKKFIYEDSTNNYPFDSVKYIEVGYYKEDNKLPDLRKYKNLEVIYNWGNINLYVDENIKHINQLKYFDVSMCRNVFFSKKIKSLPNLKILKLSDNTPVNKLPQFIYRSKNLTYLYLYIQNERCINYNKFSKLDKLQYLELGYKQSSTLSPNLSKLKNLKYLIINTHADFKTTQSIANLQNLQYLYIETLLDSSLLSLIEKMPNLQGLVMKNINLDDIEDIKRIKHLKYLYFLDIDKNSQKNTSLFQLLPNTININWTENNF